MAAAEIGEARREAGEGHGVVAARMAADHLLGRNVQQACHFVEVFAVVRDGNLDTFAGLLGTRVDVPSLEGPVKLRIPPGTQAGQRFRLRDRGAPTVSGGRGDLLIEVRIVLPAVVDERGKELMREFGKLYGEAGR